jgi:hypothetical protein
MNRPPTLRPHENEKMEKRKANALRGSMNRPPTLRPHENEKNGKEEVRGPFRVLARFGDSTGRICGNYR